MTKRKSLIIIFACVLVIVALVVVNSAVFSVRTVNAHALNYTANDPETERINNIIVNNHGIRIGSSMFTLNENRTIENVRRNLIEADGLTNIEIRAIERLFPNRLMIHYVRLVPYFFVMQNNNAYVFSNRAGGAFLGVMTEQLARQQNAVQLLIRGSLSDDLTGGFSSTIATDITRKAAVVAGFEAVVARIERRNIAYVDLTADGAIFVQTVGGAASGVRIEIRSINNFTEHFRHGFSLFYYFRNSPYANVRHQASTGTILVIGQAGGNIQTSWSE